MANYQVSVSDVFHALADPTRCAIICALVGGAQPASSLAAPFDMALPSFMQHIRFLERSGWIRTRKVGRTRQCRLGDESLGEAQAWIAFYQRLWERRLDGLEAYFTLQEGTEE